jgi:hypothetical protein
MQPYAECGDDPRAAVLQHVEQSFNTIRSHEKFWRLATKIRFQQEVYEVAGAQIEAVNRFVTERLTDHFRILGAQQPIQEALMLFALIDGVCLHWLRVPTHYPLEDMKVFILHHYANKKF